MPGLYGHAPDYSWLQGVVQKSGNRLELRYSMTRGVDALEGAVYLADDGRNSQLQDGDVVLVEGELLGQSPVPLEEGGPTRRTYRVSSMWRVR